MRHEKATRLLELARLLASSAEGLTLDEMAQAMGVGRRTAERMRDAVRRLAGLTAHPALAGLATAIRFGESPLAIGDAARLPDDELDALMLAEAGDIQHAAGTCRMTGWQDASGVVDPDLKVRGIDGLRVCDASIMPSDCRANLHFTCVMIGENLARRMSKSNS